VTAASRDTALAQATRINENPSVLCRSEPSGEVIYAQSIFKPRNMSLAPYLAAEDAFIAFQVPVKA
jgi:hypothetical protein